MADDDRHIDDDGHPYGGKPGGTIIVHTSGRKPDKK